MRLTLLFILSLCSSAWSLPSPMQTQVLVEGLQRAGRNLSREGLVDSLEGIHDLDMGLGPDFKLNYGKDRHEGFNHYVIAVVRQGKAVVIKNWAELKP